MSALQPLITLNKIAQNLLAPAAALFAAAIKMRRRFYRNDFFKTIDFGVPVVSVGNLTVGGTGKTPLVAFVARVLASKGHKVVVLTRGYKRSNPNERVLVSDGKQILADAPTAGDEPFELAVKLLGVAAIIADKNRAAAGIWARDNLGVTAFVLDDGFQHLSVKRNLDILCIDATNPFGNGKLLPAGTLREPLASLAKADCVILTRTDLAAAGEVQSLKFKVQSFNSTCPILISKTQIVGLTELKDTSSKLQNALSEKSEIRNPKSKIGMAFCALGNPNAFFESLRRENFEIKAVKSFRDHYVYQQSDVKAVEKEAKQHGAEILLTTVKDWVKLKDLKFNLPCLAVEIEIVFDDDKPLRELLGAL